MEMVENILSCFQSGDFEKAWGEAVEYYEACKVAFMEELTADTATNFAAGAILISQICGKEKKPWKATPYLDGAQGCLRFLSDFIQDREVLASTCFHFALAYEYASFFPEALRYYLLVLQNTKDKNLMQEAFFSACLMSLRFSGKIDVEVPKVVSSALSKEEVGALKEEARDAFDKMILTDPVEREEEYLKIRFEIEKRVDDEMRKIGKSDQSFCTLYWNLKKKILKEEFQITWRTPAECNPNICFQ